MVNVYNEFEVMDMMRRKLETMQELIRAADLAELGELAKSILRRYDELVADEEVIFLSLPKHDRKERERIIRSVIKLEQQDG